MKKFMINVIRLLWYLPYRILKFLRFGKVLNFPIGWDTLYPLAPYSEGGILRKDFLELYKKKKISTEDYQQKEFGIYDEEKKHYQFWDRKFSNQKYLKAWFV
ncbi:MAG: hypothetical protein WCH65_04460 [bacterium]